MSLDKEDGNDDEIIPKELMNRIDKKKITTAQKKKKKKLSPTEVLFYLNKK